MTAASLSDPDELMESARPAHSGDVASLCAIAVEHANSIRGQRGADLLLRRELPTSVEELEQQLTAAINGDDASLIVGTYNDVPFGYGLLAFEQLADGSVLARLDQLLVQAEARGVGVGESIMNEVLAQARARGCIGVDSRALPGDRETKNFFESFGLKARQLVVHFSLEADS